MAITMFMVENWDRKESKVVIVPAPAISGNANGTIEADSLPHHGKYVPKIISSAKRTTQRTSNGKWVHINSIKFNNSSPQKENNHNNTSYDRRFSDSICPCFDLKSTIIGIVPTISITAKAPFNCNYF
jgi:hypothetical protein